MEAPSCECDDGGEESPAGECGRPKVDHSRRSGNWSRRGREVGDQVDLGVDLVEFVERGAEVFVGELSVFCGTACGGVIPSPWSGLRGVEARLFADECACRKAEDEDRDERDGGHRQSERAGVGKTDRQGEDGPAWKHPSGVGEEAWPGTKCLFESHPEEEGGEAAALVGELLVLLLCPEFVCDEAGSFEMALDPSEDDELGQRRVVVVENLLHGRLCAEGKALMEGGAILLKCGDWLQGEFPELGDG